MISPFNFLRGSFGFQKSGGTVGKTKASHGNLIDGLLLVVLVGGGCLSSSALSAGLALYALHKKQTKRGDTAILSGAFLLKSLAQNV